MVLVFGKQKTAYEMRMSDWSSDVCSCDLRGCRMNYRVTTAIMLAIGIGLATGAPAQQATSTTNETPRTFVAPADRKSVGSGKSVSVRVAPGGSRVLHNTDKLLTNHTESIDCTLYLLHSTYIYSRRR